MSNDLNAGDLRGTVRGVVHPTSGLRVWPGRWFWTRRIRFDLIAWRLDEQPVSVGMLSVVCEVALGTTASWRRRIAPGTVVSFRSTGIELGPHGHPLLPLATFLGAASDPELLEAAAPVLKEDTRVTAEFGTLTRAPGAEEYSGRCDWHGTLLELSLSGAEAGDIEASLEQARALHAGWTRWEGRLRELVTRELFPLWRDWNADEAPIGGDALFRLLTLERVWITGDGSVQLTIDAGGQFTDHELVVDGTVEDGPTDVGLEG
jgi:hypothetical protein